MDPQFLDWIFKAIAVGVATMLISELKRIRESIEKLNISVAIVIEKTDNHEKRISKLEGE